MKVTTIGDLTLTVRFMRIENDPASGHAGHPRYAYAVDYPDGTVAGSDLYGPADLHGPSGDESAATLALVDFLSAHAEAHRYGSDSDMFPDALVPYIDSDLLAIFAYSNGPDNNTEDGE